MADAVPPSYYENFIESLAQIVSKLLTDKETEAVLRSIRSFQERLKRLSSQNLSRLNLDMSQPQPNQFCKHTGKTCTQNCTRGFIKAYVVAFSIKYVLGILPLLITGKVFKKPGLLKRLAGRDTALFALFLSTFLSSYKGILCLMRRLRGTTDAASDRLNAFVAGSVAGLSLVIDPDHRRRQSIMLYLLTRSIQFGGAWIMAQWAKARQRKQRLVYDQLQERGDHSVSRLYDTWEDRLAQALEHYAGVLVMMLANTQIIYAFLFHPDTLPKSYLSFLLQHSGWKPDFGTMAFPLTQVIRDAVYRMSLDDPDIPMQMPADATSREFIAEKLSPNIATIIPPNIRHNYTVCALQHPLDASCTRSKLTLFRDEYGRALKLYVPLNVIMTLVFRYKYLKKDPKTVLRKFVKSCARSSFFLAMYVSMGFATPCAIRPFTGKERHWIYLFPGLLGGAMVIFEAHGRQLELGLYCLTRAMEAWWRTMVKNGYAKNIRHGDTLLFMLSMGTMMTIYQTDKDLIASHYLSILTRFFGKN
ncbi:hypothetical protein DM01DRAFT_1331315 [Hesseltinella vesiculosa]|uniref:Transmembrane protein 135 N-terminal domain-containing protein n=1 Tax=Hesseltinella vesiculosa TaxID=101127 RepID=A0A1X2GUY9_9FUNG|nr:hypothetical protein DM01DRAFT_1331315 [Hesseltinella vesiculosa]